MNCLQVETTSRQMFEQPSLKLVSAVSRRSKRAKRNPLIVVSERLMLAAAVLSIGWFAMSSMETSLLTPPSNMATAKLTVAPGQSLWQIAASITAPGEGQIDTLTKIRALNPSLQHNQTLSAGQTIIVPAVSTSTTNELHLAANGDPVNKSL